MTKIEKTDAPRRSFFIVRVDRGIGSYGITFFLGQEYQEATGHF